MELHRIKQIGDYDPNLFNELYAKTRQLTKKLVHSIDCRRFNVTPDIVESWFDDKFMWVYFKYHKQMDGDLLLGHIINSLKMFKSRVLRKAYSPQSEFNQCLTDYGEDNSWLENIPDYSDTEFREELYAKMVSFMKKELPDDGLIVFELDSCPPEFITSKLSNPNSKAPAKLLCNFLDIAATKHNISYINALRSEIKETTKKAREFYSLA